MKAMLSKIVCLIFQKFRLKFKKKLRIICASLTISVTNSECANFWVVHKLSVCQISFGIKLGRIGKILRVVHDGGVGGDDRRTGGNAKTAHHHVLRRQMWQRIGNGIHSQVLEQERVDKMTFFLANWAVFVQIVFNFGVGAFLKLRIVGDMEKGEETVNSCLRMISWLL